MPSVSSSYDYFKTLIEYDNICLDESIKIPLPSITTFTQWLHKQALYELTKARLGNLEKLTKNLNRQKNLLLWSWHRQDTCRR